MKFLCLFITVFLVGKDTFQLGDAYLMRGIAQGAALIAGIAVLMASPPQHVLRKYWPFVGYIFCLLLSAFNSPQSQFVLLQIGSLLSMILFGIAYFDSHGGKLRERTAFFFLTLISVYCAVSIGSLIAAKFAPNLAYELLYAGDAIGYERRFRGLFSKAAMMGAASGILIGAAWFGSKSRLLKYLVIAPGLACLALTQSRTFLLAVIVAMTVTSWLTTPNKARSTVIGAMLLIVAALFVSASNLIPDQKSVSKALRVDTISTLTGRTDLWARGFEALTIRPLLGFGFTVGSEGLQQERHTNRGLLSSMQLDASRAVARVSLHNGYLQSLLDSGLIGTFFYASIFALSILRLIRAPGRRERAVEIYLLLFFAVANLGESLVYSAAVLHSAIFWLLATRALSLAPVPQILSQRPRKLKLLSFDREAHRR